MLQTYCRRLSVIVMITTDEELKSKRASVVERGAKGFQEVSTMLKWKAMALSLAIAAKVGSIH